MSPAFFKPARPGEKRRRIRDMAIIGVLLLAVAGLGLQISSLPRGGAGSPLESLLFLFLVDVNVLLVLALLFFVLRNVTKLVFERRKGVLGSRFRTKITVALVTLSLIPTLVLFFVSTSLLTETFSARFSQEIETYLDKSVEISRLQYADVRDGVERVAERVARQVSRQGLDAPEAADALRAFLTEARLTNPAASIAFYGPDGDLVAAAPSARFGAGAATPAPADENLRQALGGKPTSLEKSVAEGLIVRSLTPVRADESSPVTGCVVVDRLIPKVVADGMEELRRIKESYDSARYYRPQIEKPYVITLVLVTLLITFGAVWSGFYVSKGITGPVQSLAEGTKAIALGNYDVHIDLPGEDEMSVLVASFNRMAEDLKTSKARLDAAMADLRASAQEIEERRAYMEVVLGNVAAGVVSLDPSGRVSTVNKSAARLFGAAQESLVGRHYEQLLPAEQLAFAREAMETMARSRADSIEREMQLQIGGQTHTILVSVNRLADDEGKDLGLVIVFDDITELLKAQRASAWREVARRIAHEIKNPLTPIQLSAQRLRRKYGSRLGEDRAVFDECIDTIVKQVGDLKVLVSEFSTFARLPATNPQPNDLNRILRETARLFADAHPRIAFSLELDDKIPVFNLDAEQMRRVFTNILDNALDAIPGRGAVRVTSAYNGLLELARVEIANDGAPIPPEAMGRLFEPYFSTKEGGTGLGLAIVKQIVSDHSGYIRVRAAEPRGTIFTIELPVRA